MPESTRSAIRPTIFPFDSIPAEIVDKCADSTVDLTEFDRTGFIPPVDEPTADDLVWVHLPWRNALIKCFGPATFRRIRSDRNRHKLTTDEQDRAAEFAIGVVGLSVGHVIAHTLAMEGLAGTIRLADPDILELSNLNRVPASLVDIGENKAVVAARRIAEIDPFVNVEIHPAGVTQDTIAEFCAGLDLVIEVCDSFDMKLLVRETCRAQGIPVIMETSDGGVLDVERFDLEPTRPPFHGILGDITTAQFTGLDASARTATAAAILDGSRVTPRMAASAIEIGQTVTAWPQLAGDVVLGGATVAAAVRWMVQGRHLPSGRTRLDRDEWLTTLVDPLASVEPDLPSPTGSAASVPTGSHASIPTESADPSTMSDLDLIVHAAGRAPSAGNQQPWTFEVTPTAVTVALDPTLTSTLDLAHRASAVAVGAAAHNMAVAAAARGRGGPLTFTGSDGDLRVRLDLGSGSSQVGELDAILARHTNRAPGDRTPMPDEEAAALVDAAASGHTRAVLVRDPAAIARFAEIAGRSDRIRFLTPGLHADMMSELVSDGEPTGIDLADLALPPAMSALHDILARPEVMALLDDWDGGTALTGDAIGRIATASALLAVVQAGTSITDYARAGLTVASVWTTAESLGWAVHPMTPAFLYGLTDDELRGLSPKHGLELIALQQQLHSLWPLGPDEAMSIVLRLSHAPGPASRSRRRTPPSQPAGSRHTS